MGMFLVVEDYNGQGFVKLGNRILSAHTATVENIKLKLSTKADRYSSAETEVE
jgi:hypothetical protein